MGTGRTINVSPKNVPDPVSKSDSDSDRTIPENPFPPDPIPGLLYPSGSGFTGRGPRSPSIVGVRFLGESCASR